MPTTPATGAVEYRPALLPGGGVPLARAVRFTALVQKVMQEKITGDAVRLTRQIDADIAHAATVAREPETFAEMVGGVSAEPSSPARDLPPATGFEVFEAVVNGGYAPAFAAACVWAVSPGAPETSDTPAGFRPVDESEAASPLFPAAPFADALFGYWEGSAGLSAGLQPMPPPTASTSEDQETPA